MKTAVKDVTRAMLEAVLGRASTLEGIGNQAVEEDGVLGRARSYELYGVRSFPVADALARYDVPALVAEVKRLRGWA